MGWREIVKEIQGRYEDRVRRGLPITPHTGRSRKKKRKDNRKPGVASGPFVMIDVDNVFNETAMAFLVTMGEEKIWLPKSQIRHPDLIVVGECDFSFEVTEWIARKKNIPFDPNESEP